MAAPGDGDVRFLLEALSLKDERRSGWEHRGISYPESVAAHTFGTALLAWLFAEEDAAKAVKMALVHDLHEAVMGDVAWVDLDEDILEETDKDRMQQDALTDLLDGARVDTDELVSLWQEFTTQETDTATFVKDMDVIDRALQAYIYAQDERYEDAAQFYQRFDTLDDYFAAERKQLTHDRSRTVLDAVRARYRGDGDD